MNEFDFRWIIRALKQRGALVCRALSFKNCTFELMDGIMNVHVEKVYDRAAELWDVLKRVMEERLELIPKHRLQLRGLCGDLSVGVPPPARFLSAAVLFFSLLIGDWRLGENNLK